MTAGGKREGAGRKEKFSKEVITKRITVTVPAEHVKEIKAKIEKILKPYQKKKKP